MRFTDKTRGLIAIAVFVVIITVCAYIAVPTPIPFTLQTFGVFLAINYLGGKRGSAAVVVYLLMGIVGVPVFSSFGVGISVLLAPQGGYMIGWVFAGLLAWLMQTLMGKGLRAQVITLLAGLAVCYAWGTLWYAFVYLKGEGTGGILAVLSQCVLPFILPDLVKLVGVIFVTDRLNKILPLSK